MFRIEYDPSQPGLRAVFKPWQETAIQTLLENPGGLTSRQTWVKVNEKLSKDAISRASVINFLEALHKAGILTGEDRTGKGGHHNVYKPAMNETQLKQHIAETIIQTLNREWPDETGKAVKDHTD